MTGPDVGGRIADYTWKDGARARFLAERAV